jgi:Cytochrome oxidase complex assembly protein 1
MSTERNVGLACGLVGLVTIACVGLCGLGAALTAVGTAVGIGQAVAVVLPDESFSVTLPDWSPEVSFPFERPFDARLSELAETAVEEAIRSSDVVAQALAKAGSCPQVREALGWPLEAGALLGEVRFSDRFSDALGTGIASLTLELKGSLATGTLELAAHRGPWRLRSGTVSDGPTLSIPGTGLTLPLYLRPGEWVFDKLVVTLPGGEDVIVLAGSQ